jgi:hypothetical protein
MLEKFRSELGATCVVSEAGGGLNGALLRAHGSIWTHCRVG